MSVLHTESKENIEPGDWLLLEFGTGKLVFYVISVIGDDVILGRSNWLLWSTVTISMERAKKATYIGTGKRKWLAKFFPWNIFITPFTRPRELWWL